MFSLLGMLQMLLKTKGQCSEEREIHHNQSQREEKGMGSRAPTIHSAMRKRGPLPVLHPASWAGLGDASVGDTRPSGLGLEGSDASELRDACTPLEASTPSHCTSSMPETSRTRLPWLTAPQAQSIFCRL